MPIIAIGTLMPTQTKQNKNDSRWIRGEVMLHRSHRHILRDINQRSLPFTFVSDTVLPTGDAILLGEYTEFKLNNGRLWKTLELSEVISSDSAILQVLNVSLDEAKRRIIDNDVKFIAQIGRNRLLVREQLTTLLEGQTKIIETLLLHFGDDAYIKVASNPWEIIHMIPSYTIDIADDVATKLGLEKTDSRRFYAYFRQILDQEFAGRKDTYMSEAEYATLYYLHFSDVLTLEQFQQLSVVARSPIHKSDVGYQPTHLYVAERASHTVVTRLLAREHDDEEHNRACSERAVAASTLRLSEEQVHALTHAFHDGLHIITGGPGTGKTTVLSNIVSKLRDMRRLQGLLLVAPTGKAAARMQEQTGLSASTIHSAFGIVPDYGCADIEGSAERLQRITHVVVDEASMLDAKLFGDMCQIFLQMPRIPQLLLVGDVDQLPPVSCGQVFHDLIDHLSVIAPQQISRLYLVKRQSEGSNIPELAQMIRRGEFPDASWFANKDDVLFVPATTQTFAATLMERILQPKADALDTIQLMTPYRNGFNGDTVHAINQLVIPLYNPYQKDGLAVTHGDPQRVFRVGDRIINRTNIDTHVVNGSIGDIVAIDNKHSDVYAWSITIRFETSAGTSDVEFAYNEWKSLEHAYAITTHASQGSEYENVILLMLRESRGDFLTQNLLYTAITRARERVVLVGQPHVFQRAARTIQPKRHTALRYWLAKGEAHDQYLTHPSHR